MTVTRSEPGPVTPEFTAVSSYAGMRALSKSRSVLADTSRRPKTLRQAFRRGTTCIIANDAVRCGQIRAENLGYRKIHLRVAPQHLKEAFFGHEGDATFFYTGHAGMKRCAGNDRIQRKYFSRTLDAQLPDLPSD